LAVLSVGVAIFLSWLPGGSAQTDDPPPGPVIAQSQAVAPSGSEPAKLPLTENGPKPRAIAVSGPNGGEAKGEKPAAFRRVETPAVEAPRQPAPAVPTSPPIAGSAGTPTTQEPPLAPGPILPSAAPPAMAPSLLAPSPAVVAAPPTPALPAGPPLRLFVQAPERVAVGDVVPFTLVITNGGSAPLANVTVRDRLPAGLKHPEGDYLENDVGTLAPGESKKLELQARAVQPGTQVNQAQVLAGAVVKVSATTPVAVEEPMGLVLRQAGAERPFLGRPNDYRVEIVNRSAKEAHGVQLQARLPMGLDFVAAGSGGMYDAASRTVLWGLGTLPAGEQQAVMLRLLPRLPGVQINQLLARTAEGQEVRLQTPLQVQSMKPASLQLRVVGPDTVLTVGKELVYEVHVANPGMTALKGVQLAALLPAGVVPRHGDGPTPARVQGQEVLFAPLPSLAPRAHVVYRIRVHGSQTGVGRMRVRLLGDPSGVPVFRDFNMMVVRLQTPETWA
jgi:uncharacterized repeat protein (TIGR01451 family)